MAGELLTSLSAALSSLSAGDTDRDLIERTAREKADGLLLLAEQTESDPDGAAVAYAAELIAALAPFRRFTVEEADDVTRALVCFTRRSEESARHELLLASLAALGSMSAAPSDVQTGVLRLLASFGRVDGVSLWTSSPRTGLQCVTFEGAADPTRRMRAAAREALASGAERARERGSVHATPIMRGPVAVGALVVRARPSERLRALALAREASRPLAVALERALVLEQNDLREQTLTAASERRLARLGFDIHDGPIQDLVALSADLRHFGRQLSGNLPPGGGANLLLGRLEDFEARLVALDRELRELAHSLERTSVLERPFAEVLRQTMAAFTTRTDITLGLDLRGDPSTLTASQRLALLSVVREALVNVRDHSGASSAAITLTVGRSYTHATVTDEGRGFEVEKTLVRAARRGRLGLVGMSERVRLLGGRLDVDSRPGGPTKVSVSVPRWEPSAGAGRIRAA